MVTFDIFLLNILLSECELSVELNNQYIRRLLGVD